MVPVARQLQTLEQCGKGNIPLARVEMHLAVTEVVGQAYLTDAHDSKKSSRKRRYHSVAETHGRILLSGTMLGTYSGLTAMPRLCQERTRRISKYGRRPRLTETIA